MRLAKPASAAAARNARVHAAAKDVACRGSSVKGGPDGSREARGRGSTRARRVTGEIASEAPPAKPLIESASARRLPTLSKIVASSKAWTWGLRANTSRSRPRAATRRRLSSAK